MTRFGVDAVTEAVHKVLTALAEGRVVDAESSLVDLKEEAGRRDFHGDILPGSTVNESAAKHLAGASACMANTSGGGALVVGAADDGTLVGTGLDVEWLRHRIYELTARALTVDVRAVVVGDARLLVLKAPEAIEPIRWNGRITWRVDDNCVEVDAATWHARRMIRTQFDWSSQESQVPVSAARASAVDVARTFLRSTGEPHAAELASASSPELLRRLNVVTADGYLTNAGVIAFVGRVDAVLDYVYRDVSGGDSRQRVRAGGRGALEELQEVLIHISAHNATVHVSRGPVAGQVKEIPERAAREAVVNGLAHREWGLAQPTVVEHIGRTLRVTSPGGFFGGVNAGNIITHPSQSRNRALTELFAALRVAEREGVGVDRMVKDMLRYGHRSPEIEELQGPYVRASLVGDVVDEAWISWLETTTPQETRDDLNALLLLRRLVDAAWVDVAAARPLLQLNRAESEGALRRLRRIDIAGSPVATVVSGVPADAGEVLALSTSARDALSVNYASLNRPPAWPSRAQIAMAYSRHRGRISTTELGSIVGASPTNVGRVLKSLEESGDLRASRANRAGPGFFYLPGDGRPVPR